MALTFDAENRMTSYGGSTLTNGYRGDSLRAWKQNSTGRTYFLYAGGKIVCELSSAGTVTATNTDGPAGLISRRTSSGSVFYAFDTHGSAAQRLSSSGSVLSTQTFDAYGSRQSTDSNADPYSGYQGQSGYYTDWETGTASSALTLLTFRYYDPSAGRFLTRDPIGYAGGANAYEYCSDGPTGRNDPNGTSEGIPIPGVGSPLGGCAAAYGVLSLMNTDSCNVSFQDCKKAADCVAEAAAAVAAYGLTAGATFIPGIGEAILARFSAVEGCLEGILSGIGHVLAENYCESKKKCPTKENDCTKLGIILDIVVGCLDGLFGGLLEKSPGMNYAVREAIEAYVEGAIAALGLSVEGACESGSP